MNWTEDSKICTLYRRMRRKGSGTETIRFFLAHGGSPNTFQAEQESLLGCMCQFGDAEAVELLIKAGADANGAFPNSDGYPSPLVAALRRTNPLTIVRLLVEAGADVNPAYESPDPLLSAALQKGDLATIGYMLESGHDPTSRNGKRLREIHNMLDPEFASTVRQLFSKYKFTL